MEINDFQVSVCVNNKKEMERLREFIQDNRFVRKTNAFTSWV